MNEGPSQMRSTGPNGRAALVWDDRFLEYDFGPDHPFQMAYRGLAAQLVEAMVATGDRSQGARVRRAPARAATRAELTAFHRTSYLEDIVRASEAEPPRLLDGGDTPSFPGCLEASAWVCGGTLSALHAVTESNGVVGLQPSGGLHHAHPGRASGFCILNDVAVALAQALRGPERQVRVAYVDIDAHHGDGVMYGFYDDGRVLDIDFHQDGRTLFPGTGRVEEIGAGDGAGLKVNLPLPPGSGDEVFSPLFRRIVPTLLREFRPGLIVLQHGVDGHSGDRLAQLEYSDQSYLLACRELRSLATELCDGRLLIVGGGGYRAENVALTMARSMLAMAGVEPPPETALPAEWRNRFFECTSTTAPRDWPAVGPTPTSSDLPSAGERLLEQLGRVLGRRFGPA